MNRSNSESVARETLPGVAEYLGIGKNKVSSREVVERLLASVGASIGGPHEWDPQVNDERFFDRVVWEGSLGLGESYMDGWWEVKALDQLIFRLLRGRVEHTGNPLLSALRTAAAAIRNPQSLTRSLTVARKHYDLSNHLYQHMLDPWMQYTCAYWKGCSTLAEAQEQKLRLICEKLELKPGESVLELGCGFGGFAKYAAENYGVSVTGYNIAVEQVKFGREFCKDLPVELRLADYRTATGTFDKVVSIGLTEHVGPKNYRGLIALVEARLKPGGLYLLHTVGQNLSRVTNDPWLDTYIFPGSLMPSAVQLTKATEGLLMIEDMHNFGPDYDPTLCAWYDNVERNWEGIKSEHFDDRFLRMWRYYLLMCAGSFRARKNHLWQLVLSKGGVLGGYTSHR